MPTMKLGTVECPVVTEIAAAVCLVSPDAAARLLLRNTHNRRISEKVVEKYRREIEAGEWYASCAGVGFDDRGTLLDGQHRLAAVSRGKIAVSLLLVSGLPSAAQEKLDRQKKRTLADVFALSGVERSRQVVQVATFLAQLAMGDARGNVVADVDVKDQITVHRASLDAICGIYRAHRAGSPRVGVLAAMVIAHEKAPDETLAFARSLQTLVFEREDAPAKRIHLYLHVGKVPHGGQGGCQQREDYERAVYALNAHFAGRPVARLLRSTEFAFPNE